MRKTFYFFVSIVCVILFISFFDSKDTHIILDEQFSLNDYEKLYDNTVEKTVFKDNYTLETNVAYSSILNISKIAYKQGKYTVSSFDGRSFNYQYLHRFETEQLITFVFNQKKNYSEDDFNKRTQSDLLCFNEESFEWSFSKE